MPLQFLGLSPGQFSYPYILEAAINLPVGAATIRATGVTAIKPSIFVICMVVEIEFVYVYMVVGR